MASFVRALKKCERHNPGILQDSERIFSLHEIEVGGVNERLKKAFLALNKNTGGFNRSSTEPGKRPAACVTANASGDVLLLFIVFAAKRTMGHWLNPLPAEFFEDQTDVPHCLTKTTGILVALYSGVLKTDR